MVRIELHFLNATNHPLAVTGTVHLGEANNGTVVDHANLMFYGNLNIRHPAAQRGDGRSDVPPFRSDVAPHFGLTGHQHKRGTGVTIDLRLICRGPSIPLYVNHDWANPPLTLFNPPIATTQGQGLRYTCTFDNPTNQPIVFVRV